MFAEGEMFKAMLPFMPATVLASMRAEAEVVEMSSEVAAMLSTFAWVADVSSITTRRSHGFSIVK
jgi:hypothetical protein